jgi:hypothetical protein
MGEGYTFEETKEEIKQAEIEKLNQKIFDLKFQIPIYRDELKDGCIKDFEI